MSNSYHIIFPGGDRTKLKVLELSDAMLYELGDYTVASRNTFFIFDEASAYGKELAAKNGLEYVPHKDEDSYLD